MFSIWMPTVTNPSISRAVIAVSGPLRHLSDQKSQSGLLLGPFFVLTATWQAVDKKKRDCKPRVDRTLWPDANSHYYFCNSFTACGLYSMVV